MSEPSSTPAPRRRSLFFITALLIFALLFGAACNLTNALNADPTDIPEVEEEEKEVEPTEEEVVEPTAEEAVEPTVQAQAVSGGDGLFLTGEQAVFSDDYYTYGMFVVQNGSTNCTYPYAEYLVTAYDTAGQVVDSQEGFLESVLPGGAFAEQVYFVDEAFGLVDRFEVTLDASDCAPALATAADITLEAVSLFPGEYSTSASARVVNHKDNFFTDIAVSAVGYNAANEVVAAGYSYVNVLYPGDFSGALVSFSQAANQVVDHVVMYPALTSYSTTELDTAFFDTVYLDAYMPAIQIDSAVEMVFFLHNDNTTQSASNIRFQVTFFDASDNVVAVSTGYIDDLLPGDVSPHYITVYLPEGVNGDHHFVELMPGEFVEAKFPSNPFTADNYFLSDDEWYPTLSFDLTNASDKAMSDVWLVAVVYDKDGNFIGGGTTYTEEIGANSVTAQEITVNISGEADAVDVYGVIDFWTEIK